VILCKNNTDQIFRVCCRIFEGRELLVEEVREDNDDLEALAATSTEEKSL
jgi:hypothetical protein